MYKVFLISSAVILSAVFSSNAASPRGPIQNESRIDNILINSIRARRYLEAVISDAVQPIRLYDFNGDGLDQEEIDNVKNIEIANSVAMQMQFWTRFDLNLDGKITEKEIQIVDRIKNNSRPSVQRDALLRADLNKDGAISLEEVYGSRFANVRNIVQQHQNLENILNYDQNGDGKVTVDEVTTYVKEFFSKIDTNSNGLIDAEEFRQNLLRTNVRNPPITIDTGF